MTAITTAALLAVTDSEAAGRGITIERMNTIDGTLSEVYAVGGVAPYAGKRRWVQITTSDSAAVSGAAIQAALLT